MLTIHEIFHSIQGESTFAGERCVFVRLTGCDLRCRWCDTAYAFHEGRRLSVDEVVAAVLAWNCPLVEVTGGEPLLQADVHALMRRLLDAGRTVLLETGGHRSLEPVPEGVVRIVDIKCPGSGESARHLPENTSRLTTRDQVKFVIADRHDYEFARETIARERLASRCGAVLLSPVHGELDPKTLAEWVLADQLPARVQLQVHKYIWGAEARGV